jgi:RNA polymerase sigma-70 factor, ECF subfamily
MSSESPVLILFSASKRTSKTNFFSAGVYFMTEQDDVLFVQQTLAGNLRAFEAIVDRYQKTIYNLALKMVHDADDAEDVAQVVFLKAYEHLRSYNPKYRFFSWLYRIAMNESLNFLRQRKPFERMEEVKESEALVEEIESSELVKQVDDALMELNVEQRAVVVLKHLEGFSYVEIGQILSISEKKVKSRLFSARQVLRDVFVKKGMGRQ